MEERLKRIEKFTKAMRELLAKMLEEDPDSSSNIYKEIWGAYTAAPCSSSNNSKLGELKLANLITLYKVENVKRELEW